MPQHREQRFIPYHPDKVFDLVGDVARYPEFLPWCTHAVVHRRSDVAVSDDLPGELVLADIFVRFKMFREKFTSEITLDPHANEILIRYIDGPFRYLRNSWSFAPEGEGGTRVEFFIDFEFSNRALRILIAGLFDEAVRKLVRAFEQRAHDLYGGRVHTEGPATEDASPSQTDPSLLGEAHAKPDVRLGDTDTPSKPSTPTQPSHAGKPSEGAGAFKAGDVPSSHPAASAPDAPPESPAPPAPLARETPARGRSSGLTTPWGRPFKPGR
ncbi:MAG: type II toxin-antitoxin system RatA family toxin [Pseudomonadota bacterium]